MLQIHLVQGRKIAESARKTNKETVSEQKYQHFWLIFKYIEYIIIISIGG
jgi:hypothetical protein